VFGMRHVRRPPIGRRNYNIRATRIEVYLTVERSRDLKKLFTDVQFSKVT